MKMWKTASWVVAAGLLLAPMAEAEWLVMKDGSRVETQEGWRIEGKKGVFTSARGTLSMMRLSEVDMAATEAANIERAVPEPVRRESPTAEPVLVLTDADIPKFQTEEVGEDGQPLPSVADREPVQVVEWTHYEMESGGLEVRGTIRNTGRYLASKIAVAAQIKEDDGELLSEATAFLSTETLLAGDVTNFRMIFPDLDVLYGAPQFLVTSEAITLGSGRETMAAVDAAATDSVVEDGDAGAGSSPR